MKSTGEVPPAPAGAAAAMCSPDVCVLCVGGEKEEAFLCVGGGEGGGTVVFEGLT